MKPARLREEEILEESLALIVRECAPKRIYLFGSRAKGKAKPGSDFDFAVDAPVPDSVRRRKLTEMLEAVAGLYSANLVFLAEVDKKFREIILETGKILYEQKGN